MSSHIVVELIHMEAITIDKMEQTAIIIIREVAEDILEVPLIITIVNPLDHLLSFLSVDRATLLIYLFI